MNRRSLILLGAAVMASASFAQVELRMSDRLSLSGLKAPLTAEQQAKKHISPQGKVELIVRYDGTEAALEAITREGGEIVNLIGTRSAIVSVSRDKAEAVAAAEGVTGATLSGEVRPVNMKAREASRVDEVLSGYNLPMPYDGSGVILGVYDIGIEPNHINFFDSEGNNRIHNLWHYEDQTAQVTVYDTPTKIAGFDYDYFESHGTHVIGVAGGSFVDPDDPEHDYRGMAPGAELAIAAGLGYNAQILDGLERMGKYAQEQGKPCVANISFGDNLGPHDGSDEFTEAINDIAEKYNMMICMAAGNERDLPISIIKQFSEEDPEIKTLLLKGTTDINDLFQSFGTIEIYGEDNTPFEVYLDIISRSNPDEPMYTLQIPEKKGTYLNSGDMFKEFLPNWAKLSLISEGTPFQDIYSSSFVGGMCEVDPYNKRYHAQLNAYLQGSNPTMPSRYFVRLRVKGQSGKKVFVYCDGTYMSFGTKNMPGLDSPDGNGTHSNMGSGKNTISVGSYVTANIEDSPYTYGNVGDISWFSAYGETPDGRFLPEICAPGQVIISSRNSKIGNGLSSVSVYPIHYTYYDRNTRKTYEWTSCAGTSQASPHVAGVIALWLEANPDLGIADVKRILAETAAPALTDDEGWGAGRIDAYAGLKAAIHSSDVKTVNSTNDKVLMKRIGNSLEVFVPGAPDITVEIYSVDGRKINSATYGGDSAVVSFDALNSGLYVVRVAADGVSRSIKINL